MESSNKAIENPECICFNCLKEKKVKTIEILQTGWGSRFDGLSTKIQLCDECYKLTNSKWWKLKPITIKKLGDDFSEYRYEDEILKYVEKMPLAGQELFFNHFAYGAGGEYMNAQDWIDCELGLKDKYNRKEI